MRLPEWAAARRFGISPLKSGRTAVPAAPPSPNSIDVAVRRSLEERCGRSCLYRGAGDLFAMAEDDANGIWSINHAEAERQRRLTYYSRAY